MSTKQEIASDATLRHDHFHLILMLHVKIVKLPQQHVHTTVHYQVAKSSILNEAEF